MLDNNTLENKVTKVASKTKKAILLVNLGTPNSPEPSDIRVYLNEFLSDPRVIDIHPVGRFMLVKMIILPTRPRKVSKYYKHIWMDNGSPLLVHGRKVQEQLQKKLGDDYDVQLAMRYGNPSIQKALDKFKSSIYESIKVIPLFPQYASASTASVIEKVMRIVKDWPSIPNIDIKSYFYNDPDYIHACVEVGKTYLTKEKYDHILFSFHGIPERHIKNGDYENYCKFGSCCETITEKNQFCYRAQCVQTAYSIAEKLGFTKEQFTICFQSRLGRTPWIKPYTDFVIKEMAQKGHKKLLVFAPSFVSDCLETAYEISVEYDELFKSVGGEKVQLVESLNSNPVWIDALEKIVLK
ncbi:MAG: ferrochelatase [Candidatus Sericytochromatia bacterium]|nr:ferrochelatase [Candidatus Sericytochromatia bacterium]